MKKLTMVMRCGDAKAAAEAMYYTLIGEDYSFERMSGSDIAKAIASKKIEVTNLGVSDKGLVATNGAMKNYTLVDPAGNLVGEPRAVILNRVETDKGLLGYTAYSVNGTLQELTVQQAVELAKASKIANGKIRHTQTGDIVASISGLYPLRILKIAEQKDESITLDLMFIGSAISGRKSAKYAGVIVNGKNAAGISKVYTKLVSSNAKLIEAVSSFGDADAASSLGIKRTGTAGFYGVYPIDTVYKLVEQADNKVSLPMGNLIIACTDYDADKAEANVTLSAEMKKVGTQSGTEKANAALVKYVGDVLQKLKTVKFSK
jgi:hypothetical protein